VRGDPLGDVARDPAVQRGVGAARDIDVPHGRG
jgi:hypothetical protein